MNSKISSNHESVAREAALAYAESDTVGALIEILDEGDHTNSYVFASTLKGYLGWRWSVTLFEADPKNPTLSEVMLLPGEESLVAPAWVPWSERLADYKALQAELDAQAAADAAEAVEAEVADEDEDEDEDDDNWVEPVEEDDSDDDSEDVLAAPDLEPGEDAESETEDAGDRPPRSARRNRRWGRKKDR
jgi:hypothetical protein